MTDVRVRGQQSRRGPKASTLLTVALVVVLAVVALTQRALIAQVIDALRSGALPSIVAAALLEGVRICLHALTYTRAFRVIGATVPLRATVPAYFKMIFMNTVLPSGGTSGMAAVVDAARSRGVAVGSATSATVFVQTCYYSAMFLVIVVGFCVMGASGTLTARDVLFGSTIGIAAATFLSLLALGHLKPGLLQRVMRRVEALVARACRLVRLPRAPRPWADALVHSFSSAATELSRRPWQALGVFGTMALAMGFDLLAFVAAGWAFGITALPALLGGYVTALVFNSFNVTPGGVGIVEGLAAAVLAGYGYPGTIAVSAVLTYRALMYWIPFAVGGVMMRLTGAFALRREGAPAPSRERAEVGASVRERICLVLASHPARRAALCAGIVAACGVFEMVASGLPRDAAVLDVLAQYAQMSAPMNPVLVVSAAYLLLLCVPGLAMRDQGCWLLSVAGLACLGATSALSGNPLAASLAPLVTLVLLVVWHDSFGLHLFLRSVWRLACVLLYGVLLAVAYATVGMALVSGEITPQPDVLGAAWLGLQALVTRPEGVELGAHAGWVALSVRTVAVTLVAAMCFVLALLTGARVADWTSPARAEMRAFNRREARAARDRRRADRREARAARREWARRADIRGWRARADEACEAGMRGECAGTREDAGEEARREACGQGHSDAREAAERADAEPGLACKPNAREQGRPEAREAGGAPAGRESDARGTGAFACGRSACEQDGLGERGETPARHGDDEGEAKA